VSVLGGIETFAASPKQASAWALLRRPCPERIARCGRQMTLATWAMCWIFSVVALKDVDHAFAHSSHRLFVAARRKPVVRVAACSAASLALRPVRESRMTSRGGPRKSLPTVPDVSIAIGKLERRSLSARIASCFPDEGRRLPLPGHPGRCTSTAHLATIVQTIGLRRPRNIDDFVPPFEIRITQCPPAPYPTTRCPVALIDTDIVGIATRSMRLVEARA